MLVEAERGLQSFDEIDIGSSHLVEELPRVERKAFDVLALPFCEKGSKGKRAFATAATTRDTNKLIPGDVYIDVF